MRVTPTALVAVGVLLLYAAIVVGVQKLSGIPYTDFGDSTSAMVRSVIPSLALGAAAVALLGWWTGWWGAALRDRHRTRVGWTLTAPVIYLVITLGTFAATDWGNISGGFLLVALALGILVGFAEEFVCRGLLIVGLRGTFHEVAVWALTCIAGQRLLHPPTALRHAGLGDAAAWPVGHVGLRARPVRRQPGRRRRRRLGGPAVRAHWRPGGRPKDPRGSTRGLRRGCCRARCRYRLTASTAVLSRLLARPQVRPWRGRWSTRRAGGPR